MKTSRQRSKSRAIAKDKRDLECLREMIRKVKDGAITGFAYGVGQHVADSEPILAIQTARDTEDTTKCIVNVTGFLDSSMPTERTSIVIDDLSVAALELVKISACSSVMRSDRHEGTTGLQWYELN